MPKPLNSLVKLTRAWWDGPEPETGDHLVTPTGRRYLILNVRGKQLHCQVISPEEARTGREWLWKWSARELSAKTRTAGTP